MGEKKKRKRRRKYKTQNHSNEHENEMDAIDGGPAQCAKRIHDLVNLCLYVFKKKKMNKKSIRTWKILFEKENSLKTMHKFLVDHEAIQIKLINEH